MDTQILILFILALLVAYALIGLLRVALRAWAERSKRVATLNTLPPAPPPTPIGPPKRHRRQFTYANGEVLVREAIGEEVYKLTDAYGQSLNPKSTLVAVRDIQ